jgi:hypothetical protein
MKKKKHNLIFDGTYYKCTQCEQVGNWARMMAVHAYDANKKLFKGQKLHPVDLMPEIIESYKY